jgi:hypothetical protein
MTDEERIIYKVLKYLNDNIHNEKLGYYDLEKALSIIPKQTLGNIISLKMVPFGLIGAPKDGYWRIETLGKEKLVDMEKGMDGVNKPNPSIIINGDNLGNINQSGSGNASKNKISQSVNEPKGKTNTLKSSTNKIVIGVLIMLIGTFLISKGNRFFANTESVNDEEITKVEAIKAERNKRILATLEAYTNDLNNKNFDAYKYFPSP